jgi:hypothetical protein
MANNKEEAGKGTPRPGEMPGAKRPYATIDLRATEVEGRDPPPGSSASKAPAATASGSAAAASTPSADKSASKPADAAATSSTAPGAPGAKDQKAEMKSTGTAAALASRRRATRLVSHLAAGAVGAVLVLIAARLVAPEQPPARPPEIGDLQRRLADIEGVLGTRPNAGLRGRIDEMGRSVGALGEAQAKLARDTKALESKVGGGQEIPQELVGRLTRLEDMLSSAPTGDPAAQSPQLSALSARLGELQKAAKEAGDIARSGIARFDAELSAVRTEAGRLAQKLDGLKGEVEERLKGAARSADLGPVAAGLKELEQRLQALLKGETERSANASRIVLTLELANLKRAIDRGEAYGEELARVHKVAGTLNLAGLERYKLEGVPTPAELTKSFRKAANAMLDAEEERADATLVDRLLAGARGIVRVRKAGHPADDTSAEAVVGRMEAALKEGRLAEVLAGAKKLPPKAALAGEDWVKKVEARRAVEQALADVEAALKASLAAAPAGTDTRR